MDASEGRKTEQDYWDGVHSRRAIRQRLPSPWRPDTRNFMRLTRRYVKPGDRVAELGFAPGKNLAWVAARLGAEVTGLDFSKQGVDKAQQLFDSLGIHADLRCEDLFDNDLPAEWFDVVYSHGVIEHFDDPRPAVQEHVRLVKPGGVALLAIPNFGGIYGRIQRRFDPDNIAIHNLDIMTVPALGALAPPDARLQVRAFPFGRVIASLISWEKRWSAAAPVIRIGLDGLGLLQPVDIPPLCPWLVLEVRRLEN